MQVVISTFSDSVSPTKKSVGSAAIVVSLPLPPLFIVGKLVHDECKKNDTEIVHTQENHWETFHCT